MPRQPRFVLPHTAHHVVARGNNRERLFRHGFDKRKYLERFNKVAAEEKVLIHGYCLMDNHVHWILTPTSATGLERLFRRVHTYWACRINFLTGRTGHLFEGRFHSSPLNENHYWTALRYVEINPRRAGLVQRPEDWEFSSARAHLTDGPLTEAALITLTAAQTRRRFETPGWREFLNQPDLETEKSLRKAIQTSRPSGPVDWIRDLEAKYKRKLTGLPPGRPPIDSKPDRS